MEKVFVKGKNLNLKERELLPIGSRVFIGNSIYIKEDKLYFYKINSSLISKVSQEIFPVLRCIEKIEWDWNRFKQGRIAINCETQEEADKFFKMYNVKFGTRSTTNLCWSKLKNLTCFRFCDDLLNLGYASVNWYKEKGFEVIKFKDVIFSKKKPMLQPKIFNTNKFKTEKGIIKYRIKNNETFITINKEKKGSAKKNPGDLYNERYGILIATARALGIEKTKVKEIIDVIFDNNKTIDKLSNDDLLKTIKDRMV